MEANESLSDEKRAVSKKLHNQVKNLSQREQFSACSIVLGVIFLITGLVFIVLSFERRMNKFVGINFNSLAFYICVIGISLGAIFIIGGIVMLYLSMSKRKQVQKEINKLRNN